MSTFVRGIDHFAHERARHAIQRLVSENGGGVDPAGQDRQSVKRNIPHELAPVLECKIFSDAALDPAPGEVQGDRMRTFARFAFVFANHDVTIIVTLDFRARNAAQTNEAKPPKHTFRTKILCEKFFVAQAVLQGEQHCPLMQERRDIEPQIRQIVADLIQKSLDLKSTLICEICGNNSYAGGRVSDWKFRVIKRAPLLNVKYAQAHWKSTASRLRKPTRKMMCTKSQANQAGSPLRCMKFKSATALFRPIVAMLPLSQ